MYLVAQLCLTLFDPGTVACQAPLSMGFSGQDTGVDCHSLLQGNLSNPGVKPRFPALQADSLLSKPPGKPHLTRWREKSKVDICISPGPYLRGCPGMAALPHWGRTSCQELLSLQTHAGDALLFSFSLEKESCFSVLLVLRTLPSLVVSSIPYRTVINKL